MAIQGQDLSKHWLWSHRLLEPVLPVVSDHSCEAHPNWYICLAAWDHSKGGRVQTKKVVTFGQTFPLGALWDHHPSHLNRQGSQPGITPPTEVAIHVRTATSSIGALGMGGRVFACF